jgi:hypothetical protein
MFSPFDKQFAEKLLPVRVNVTVFLARMMTVRKISSFRSET